jgi:hypothetical protein
MIRKLILAVVIAVLVTLGCILLGAILAGLNVLIATIIGDFLKTYGAILGVLAGFWFYFNPFTR